MADDSGLGSGFFVCGLIVVGCVDGDESHEAVTIV
jgi:hypothetical protein